MLSKLKHWVYLLVNFVTILIGALLCSVDYCPPWSMAIGTSLIATGIAGLVAFLHVFISEKRNKQMEVLSEFGITEVFAGRSVQIRKVYENRFDAAREQIDVMGFGLKAFREDFKDRIDQWLSKVSMRVLLIDPEFPSTRYSYSKQRDTEEDTSGTIESDVKQFVKDLGRFIEQGKFKIRLYQCLPSVNVLRIDDELFWGPYLMCQQSRNSPTFLVQRGGILFERMNVHFNKIWESDDLSREVPNEWLDSK